MRITLDLPPDLSRRVEDAMQIRGYPDVGAFVTDALASVIGSQDDLLGYDMTELRRLGDEGERSGPVRDLDIPAIMTRMTSGRDAP